jgi:hypothetical protein
MDAPDRVRTTTGAALSVGSTRESIASMRASIRAQVDGADSLLTDSSAAFRLAWFTARGVATVCRGVTGMVTAYRGLAGDEWADRVENVVARLGTATAEEPAELLQMHDELLGELESLLDLLDASLRAKAVEGLGSGQAITDADLNRLLA